MADANITNDDYDMNYVPCSNMDEVNAKLAARPTGKMVSEYVNKTANAAVKDLKTVQHDFNEQVRNGFTAARAETDRLARSVVSMQKELVARSCIVKGIPTFRPPTLKETRGTRKKKIYTLKELPFETMEVFRSKVLPSLGINPDEIAIESATRFMQNPDRDDAPGIRVRFMSQQDRHMVFKNLGKLKGKDNCRGWHFSSDFPEYLAEAHKKMEFVAAEYRARYNNERNTNVVHDKMEVRLQQKAKGDRTARWELVSREETDEIMKLIIAGKGLVAEKKGKAKGLPQPLPENLVEAAKNISLAPVALDASLLLDTTTYRERKRSTSNSSGQDW